MTCELTESTIEIVADQVYVGDLLGLGDADTFKYSMITNETVTFTINLSISGLPPKAKLTLYSVEGDELIIIGVAFLRQNINIFNHDGTVGDYFFCLESEYPTGIITTDYTLEVEFTDYDGVIFTNMMAYSGEYSEAEFYELSDFGCKSATGFELLYGDLPDGFIFYGDGRYFGVPGEQDCESEEDELPSFTWAEDQDQGRTSTSKEYEVMIRTFLVDYPDIYDDKRFKICVHNNWTKDKDAFMAAANNFDQLTFQCKDE